MPTVTSFWRNFRRRYDCASANRHGAASPALQVVSLGYGTVGEGCARARRDEAMTALDDALRRCVCARGIRILARSQTVAFTVWERGIDIQPGNADIPRHRRNPVRWPSWVAWGSEHGGGNERANFLRETAMRISSGTTEYSVGGTSLSAHGVSLSEAELDDALANRLPSMLRDDAGKKSIQDLVGGLAKTEFASDVLMRALIATRPMQDWLVGESLSEAYLVDHRGCEFPWPTGRDLRNPNASPAGADLVGFHAHNGTARFAFGEVKTSEEEK